MTKSENFKQKRRKNHKRLLRQYQSPYCRICNSCGVIGCCPPTMCTFEKGCKYPKTNESELKISYMVLRELTNKIYKDKAKFWETITLLEDIEEEIEENYYKE